MEVYQVGYFARSDKWTKCHVTKNGKCLCGYKPHETMEFQWCAGFIILGFIECPKCKKMAGEILTKQLLANVAEVPAKEKTVTLTENRLSKIISEAWSDGCNTQKKDSQSTYVKNQIKKIFLK